MVKYHLRTKEPQWRRRAIINGTAAVLSFIVDIVIIVTKFTEGAWTIVIILPSGVVLCGCTASTRPRSASSRSAPPGQRGTDLRATSSSCSSTTWTSPPPGHPLRRSLSPDDIRAVHFDIDSQPHANSKRSGAGSASRRSRRYRRVPRPQLSRAAIELVAEAVADGETECTCSCPAGVHVAWRASSTTAPPTDRTVVSSPHVAATIVPFN